MSVEVKVPVLPESVADATVAKWHKKAGDAVQRDEHLVDIETDKVVLEVVAQANGILKNILRDIGSTVKAEEVIGVIEAGAAAPVPEAAAPAPEAAKAAAPISPAATASAVAAGPAARRLAHEHGIAPEQVPGSGKGGRVTSEDINKAVKAPLAPKNPSAVSAVATAMPAGARHEERVPMTRLRARIAERLLQAQSTAAILTTFNEINMAPAMELRTRYKQKFEEQHGARLGFMSFFVKATVEALKRFPIVNASIDGNDVVYHGYHDIGVAVSSPRGLVVPIIRNAETMNFADIERKIAEFGQKAKNNELTLEDMTGGTFTISNGGVFGSLMSTPILNPPQTGILGMHKIQDRPVVENGQIVIRPMMYVALSYDHRLIDGSESVRFLITIKEMLEDPTRLLLEI